MFESYWSGVEAFHIRARKQKQNNTPNPISKQHEPTNNPKTNYSKIAKYYDKVRVVPADALLSRIAEYGKICSDSFVLDVGCGTGRFPLKMFHLRNFVCCALEPSREMLKEAITKDKSKHIMWIQGDGQNLPFQDNVFDCVYMTMVIHHIENKELALREIYRTLKKSRNCVIMTISHGHIKRHILHDFPGVTTIDLKRVPSIPSLKEKIANAGFRDVRHHLIRYEEGEMPTSEYLERVKAKYISTLTLLSEESSQRGFKIFQQRIQNKYGACIKRMFEFVFAVGRK
jgi:ubiquinone/menaquinone biosynthesis C-methylase UbiE